MQSLEVRVFSFYIDCIRYKREFQTSLIRALVAKRTRQNKIDLPRLVHRVFIKRHKR